MIGFFLFLLTLDFLPHYCFVLLVLWVIYDNRQAFFKGEIDYLSAISVVLVLAITGLSFLNSLIHISQLDSLFNLFPYTFLMLGSLIVGKYISQRDLKILISLIALEALIAIVEFSLGVNTILIWKDYFVDYSLENTREGLLYFNKSYGLSSNSSVIAEKTLVAILLIYYFDFFKGIRRTVVKLLLFIGLLLSFQWTSIVVLVLFLLLFFLSKLITAILKSKILVKLNIKSFVSVVLVVCLLFLGLYKARSVAEQFTRGDNKIELSGRMQIWPKFIHFIENNIWFGNYSQKLRVAYNETSTAHAHHSFLQVLANHGIIIFMVYLLLIILSVRTYNWVYISSLIILSLFQYALFWGISLNDIVFFIFALQLPNRRKNMETLLLETDNKLTSKIREDK